jgi:8-oxo-dGTP pyrophosphatase MutT (NUDIX family)
MMSLPASKSRDEMGAPIMRNAPIPAASVAFVRDSVRGIEVYLSRRPPHFRYYPGAYVFPGGRQDKDDTDLRATASREVLEEIGVSINPELLVPLRHTHTAAHAGPVYHLLTFAYHVEGDFSTSINLEEIDDEIWIRPAEALARLDIPYQIGAAVHAIARFESVEELMRALRLGTFDGDYWI